ncbi:hypothetical protein GCM10022212_04650 [Actimicrobium antarcticum]|uniref:Uncharacterized protein n=1 Tax=Actimicrobium antarcticum TaxID=1051899 RepID=A0ABP7SM72_9BURK
MVDANEDDLTCAFMNKFLKIEVVRVSGWCVCRGSACAVLVRLRGDACRIVDKCLSGAAKKQQTGRYCRINLY